MCAAPCSPELSKFQMHWVRGDPFKYRNICLAFWSSLSGQLVFLQGGLTCSWSCLLAGSAGYCSAVFPVTQWWPAGWASWGRCASVAGGQVDRLRREGRPVLTWESGRPFWGGMKTRAHTSEGNTEMFTEDWPDPGCSFEFICFYKEE